MSEQRPFGTKVNELIRQARRLPPEVCKRVIELLNEARIEVIARIANADPQSYTSVQRRAMLREIDAELDVFRRQMSEAVTSREGDKITDEPLRAAGLPAPTYAGFSMHALAIAQGYTVDPDLVTGLPKDSVAKVDAAIQRAFFGGKSMVEIIEEIGKALSNGQEFTGIFSAIGRRAESIATNEILRVHTIAAQAKMEDAVQRNPEIKKQWIHVAACPIIAHSEAEGQVRAVGDPFDIGGEKMMYPHDPNGSPGNTVNCHCLMRPYLDSSALKPTPRRQQILRDLGIKITVE